MNDLPVRPSGPRAPLCDPQEARAFLAANPDIRFIDAMVVDVCGKMRGKRYPRADLEKLYTDGMQIPETVFLLDVLGDAQDPCGYGFSDGDPDGTAYPLPGYLMPVPWAPAPHAQVLLSMFERSGAPMWMEPRTVLDQVVRRFAEIKLVPVVALELEFFLLEKARDAAGAPVPAASPRDGRPAAAAEGYGLLELDRYGDFIAAIDDAAGEQGLPASTATRELAPAQFEVNLRHTDDCLGAADQAALLRHLVMGVARAQGLDATFMPKPYANASGSGLHIHVSLLDESGHNVFQDGGAEDNPFLRHAIGGLKETLIEGLALFAPDINAMRRYEPKRFVPVNASWAVNNRSAAFRIPLSAPSARRVEHRVAGANANPYLALAAVLAGLHHGLLNECDPGPPGFGNLGEEPDPQWPDSFSRALDCLAEAEILRTYLGARYLDTYVALKRAELAKFLGVVTPREYEWYL